MVSKQNTIEKAMFSNRDVVRLLVPLIVEQILAVLVGMVDVIMVAAVGETAVSGVSLVDSISMLMIQVLSALATGGAVVCAQYIGKKDLDRACRTAGQLFFITLLFSAIISALALVGNRYILGLVFGKVEPAVMNNASIYFYLCALSYPFLAVYNACAALFRSMGNSRVSMMVSMLMNGINVAGNAICIYGLHMGVAGVGIPTLLSRMTAAVVIFVLIQNPNNLVSIKNVRALKLDGTIIKNILGVGVPAGLENSLFQIGKLILQSLVSSLGTASIAAFAVSYNLATLLYLTGIAIGNGLITIVGQCAGAGKMGQAKKYTKKLIGFNYGVLAVACTFMVVFSKQFVGIYHLSPEASAVARQMIIAHSIAMIIWPLGFVLPNFLRACNHAAFTMAVSSVCMWAFRIGLAYVLVKQCELGIMGVWYAMFVDWFFRAIVFMWKFYKI